MIIHWPQFVWLILVIINLITYAQFHGKPREPYNFHFYVCGLAISVFILYFGGFFTGGPPQ